jgi:hypothetical protein
MPKRTQKYVAALKVAARLKIPELEKAELLYEDLNAKNYFWNADKKKWLPGAAPVPATELIRVRTWAETSRVESIADSVVFGLVEAGFILLEKSKPYMCRPPNQNESRVYLTFREATNEERS